MLYQEFVFLAEYWPLLLLQPLHIHYPGLKNKYQYIMMDSSNCFHMIFDMLDNYTKSVNYKTVAILFSTYHIINPIKIGSRGGANRGGGRGFDPWPGHYNKSSFSSIQATVKVFSLGAFHSKF